jgi:N-acetylgalactosamine-N,N'-diacetylbacillosaminyl-diphospho-undecaprenol 4-alpha-N-acetylgalactosaminyltransferase
MDGGGAERSVATLLRHLDRARFRPSLTLFRRTGPFLRDVPPDVPVHDLQEANPYAVWTAAARLDGVIRRLRPAVVLSVLKHPNLVTLALGGALHRDLPVVVSERDTLSLVLRHDRGRALKRLLHRRLYPRARAVVAISAGVKADLEREFGIAGRLIRVIHNPCDADRVRRLAAEDPALPLDPAVPIVVAAGRLSAQKGFDDLLRAFALVARRRVGRLLILGEGPAREPLIRQAAALGIADRVGMPGFLPNPFPILARARLFVLSSLREGFANVVVEALALGVPVVATDCPSGPGEILRDGIDGRLVPPAAPEALAAAMADLLDDAGQRARLSVAGRTRAEAFAPSVIVPRYEALLAEALGGPVGRHRGGPGGG